MATPRGQAGGGGEGDAGGARVWVASEAVLSHGAQRGLVEAEEEEAGGGGDADEAPQAAFDEAGEGGSRLPLPAGPPSGR